MGLGTDRPIVLHISGMCGDKNAATYRFIRQYCCLDANIRQRLVIQNDEAPMTPVTSRTAVKAAQPVWG